MQSFGIQLQKNSSKFDKLKDMEENAENAWIHFFRDVLATVFNTFTFPCL